MQVKYTKEEIQTVVEQVRENPKGFLKLAKQFSSLSEHQIIRAMRAWGIDPNEEDNSSNWSSREWEDDSD